MADLLNLSKTEADNLLNLRKEKIQTLCLEKKTLQNIKSRVALVLDYSGSMRNLYKNGTVQSIIERILPIAMQFDDDGEMELWLFDDSYRHLEPINLNNYYGYVEKNILGKWHMGATRYSPIIKDIKYTYIDKKPEKISNYIIFITAGDNSDKTDTKITIKEVSKHPIFFQFVGIGNDNFSFLEKLDDLEDRYVDNANFFSIKDINQMSDNEIYNKLLAEFPSWLENIKVKKIIENQPSKNKVENITKNKSEKKGFFSKIFK